MELDKDKIFEALQQIFYDADEDLGIELTVAGSFPAIVENFIQYYEEA